ncbi:MAG TPA: 1-deoxy-D-xylulose-5-phosphate reductoisomerase [Candidatus Krumholzibacteria bacterium]|nr:1-deoxy-D-xylulose-5-phosphate reductoisomerase [Candidatus Krumholzibacteria bacterium]
MNSTPRQIVLLGATGSIGTSTVDLVRRYPERFEIVGMTAHRSASELATLADTFGGARLQLTGPGADAALRAERPDLAPRMQDPGPDGLLALLEQAPGAMVVNGLVGAAGLAPTVWSLERGHDVALANKEALVVGGPLVLDAARRSGARLWPVDSEHSAIAQCLRGNPHAELSRIWLTASGGPFRDRDPETLAEVGLDEVLDHPTWDMGPKVTVDSATMMNKGLEVLEAHFLFDVPIERIEVVVHRESIVHSLIELRDGAFLAQMGAPDMRVPILYALGEGEHLASAVAPWSPLEAPTLHFEAPDRRRYPCLDLARRAGEVAGAAPIVLNAANEVAVAALLRGELSFGRIPGVIERALERIPLDPVGSVDEALRRDRDTREQTAEWLRRS